MLRNTLLSLLVVFYFLGVLVREESQYKAVCEAFMFSHWDIGHFPG